VLLVRRDLFLPSTEGEGRLLLLIDAFSQMKAGLEGRTKLAKLDFLLRYPNYFERALSLRAIGSSRGRPGIEHEDIENRMVRYRYGPWDPAYFSLLGSLIGRGLIIQVPAKSGVAYRTTKRGKVVAATLGGTESWRETAIRTRLLRRHFDLTGTRLKAFIYQHFPEVVSAAWGKAL
jgi:hypothetical protein